jgi:iron complex outermembrane recepter protein
MKLLSASVSALALAWAASPALAQQAGSAPEPAQAAGEVQTIIVTGSSIRRRVDTSALPLQIITTDDLRRDGITSPEQLLASITTNVAGLDNLASNADVTENRSARGASFANLRGQGAAGTLVLLNGRRVAAHGLSGGAVDINQLPISAMQRVDVLKDGASAVYGTDAIGGVMNFITKEDFVGLSAQAFSDVTEEGGGNIYRASLMAGWGDIDDNGFNLMGVLSFRKNEELLASDRDFINGFQPERGLSIDTRGAPFGTIFPFAAPAAGSQPTLQGYPRLTQGTLIASNATAPLVPGTTDRASGGINPLNLPGAAGCDLVPGMKDYAENLWLSAPNTGRFACAWDTGESTSIQQEQDTFNLMLRGVGRLGEHRIIVEYLGSDATAENRFSHAQFSPSANTTEAIGRYFAFPRIVGRTDQTYDRIHAQLRAAFPTDTSLVTRFGLPIAVRWRCIECGRREITTETETGRLLLGAEGPFIFDDWSYRTGLSQAYSESQSTLGQGYYYAHDFFRNGTRVSRGWVDVFNEGWLNPFLRPGETQTAEGLAELQKASAAGTVLFGGRFTLTQLDFSASGPLFTLPGGQAYGAIGIDLRREEFEFNGDTRAIAERPTIHLAPFDQDNIISGVSRDVKAIFAEVVLPLFTGFEVTLAVRTDEYDGFGRTTNPKVNFTWRPIEPIMFRGSYNTGFRVPTFNQIYNRPFDTELANTVNIPDPETCPSLVVSATVPGCGTITALTAVVERTGGNPEIGPEEAEQHSFGAVLSFARNARLSLDWWRVERTNAIPTTALSRAFMLSNYNAYRNFFIRDAQGRITVIDRRFNNLGGFLMEGLEVSARNSGNLWGGQWSAGLDGTYMINRQTKPTVNSPYSINEVGAWTRFQDITLDWRHTAFINFSYGNWAGTLSQNYRSSYLDNNTYLGILNGNARTSDLQIRVSSYTLYNTTLSYRGFDGLTVTAGIRNLLNTDPPFTKGYDSDTGAGSSWEPRLVDPRGRSYTLSVEYAF